MPLAHPISIKFRPDQMERIRKEAEKEEDRNLSRVVRRIVDSHFKTKRPVSS